MESMLRCLLTNQRNRLVKELKVVYMRCVSNKVSKDIYNAQIKQFVTNAHRPLYLLPSYIELYGVCHVVFRPVIPKDSQFVVDSAESNVGMIVGVGSVESSYLKQCALCVSDYHNPDIAVIMVYIQYLTQLEGPMWKQIRGQGLAYHYQLVRHLCRFVLNFLAMIDGTYWFIDSFPIVNSSMT